MVHLNKVQIKLNRDTAKDMKMIHGINLVEELQYIGQKKAELEGKSGYVIIMDDKPLSQEELRTFSAEIDKVQINPLNSKTIQELIKKGKQ